MRGSLKLGIVLALLWTMVGCSTAPAPHSGRTREEAEARHAELIRRQNDLERRYVAPAIESQEAAE